MIFRETRREVNVSVWNWIQNIMLIIMNYIQMLLSFINLINRI